MYRISLIFILSFIILNDAFAQQVDTSYIQRLMDSLDERVTSNQTFEQAKLILELSKQADYTTGIGYALVLQGNYLLRVGEHEESLSNYQSLYELGEAEGKQNFINNAYYGIGKVYDALTRFEDALAYFQKSIELSQERGNKKLLAFNYNSVGAIYSKKGVYREAIDYLLKAKQLLESIDELQKIPLIDNNIGIAYVQLGQAKRSIPFFEDVLELSKKREDSLNLASSYGNLAYAHQNIPNFEKAFTYYDSSLYYSSLMKQNEVTYITYLDMSDAYKLKQDFKNALVYREKHQNLKENTLDERTKSQINELKVKFETSQKERALITKEREVNDLVIARQRMVLLIGGLLASLGITLLIFFKVRDDNKKKLQLQKAKEALVKIQLKNKELETNQLQQELKGKEVDLTNLALDIARKNKFSKELIQKLEVLQSSSKRDFQSQLKNVIRFVEDHLRVSEALALLQENIEEINQRFYKKLDAQFEKLSTKDKYMLGLIRLNLSNKDIATLKGISPSSAKVLRYRLRKKLNLTPDVDFAKFLQEF